MMIATMRCGLGSVQRGCQYQSRPVIPHSTSMFGKFSFRERKYSVYASNDDTPETEGMESDMEKAKAEAERLRAAEKFMVVGTGEAECKGCGYVYKPANGDPEYPIPKGVKFNDLPEDWNCPVCGAEKKMFQSRQKEIAGFAENQGYGLGTNSMTAEQKNLLIFGSLAGFFVLFLLGYAMN